MFANQFSRTFPPLQVVLAWMRLVGRILPWLPLKQPSCAKGFVFHPQWNPIGKGPGLGTKPRFVLKSGKFESPALTAIE